MIASFTFNRQASSLHAYQSFTPSTWLLESEEVKPGGFMPVFIEEDGRVRVQYGRWGMPAQGVFAGSDRLVAPARNIFQRPSFGEAVRLRRCLVPVDSIQLREMITVNSPEHELHHQDDELFCLAGIYAWRDGSWGEEALGIALVTAPSPLHWRDYSSTMPLVLSPQAAKSWVNPETSLNVIANLLQPAPASMLRVRSISSGESRPAILHEQAA
ncbi:MAG: SOS response-associated peptidase family protein [Bacteroidia bacterium]